MAYESRIRPRIWSFRQERFDFLFQIHVAIDVMEQPFLINEQDSARSGHMGSLNYFILHFFTIPILRPRNLMLGKKFF